MSTFGQELRRERELREISLREVAEATKISLRYLEALEQNDFKDLPGGVFNRGFVRAYSQYIGVDPETMVTAYLAEEQSRGLTPAPAADDAVLRGTPTVPSPPKARGTAAEAGSSSWLRWALVAVAIAVIGGGGFLLYRASRPTTFADAPSLEPAARTELPPPSPEAADPTTTTEATETDDPTEEEEGAPPPEQPNENEAAAEEPQRANRSPAARDTDPEPRAGDVQQPARTSPEPLAVLDPPAAQRPAASAPPVTAPETVARDRDVPSTVPTVPRVTVFVDRATDGRLNCDNRQIEILDGMRPGTSLLLSCKRFLIVDVGDAGALRLAVGSGAPSTLGLDGERVVARRIELRDEVAQ
jgi:cytoskeletal protein RodZ